ncbi:hypothetical protein JSY36_17680 [Bacillus sp. H-16]|uniref:hypothetical protein n=1 Tax=Alteribacter salitolerans TaxID=2912333 RepID=UPI001965BCD0|nr:hypothetical protein [Alteribacter salitolerans]MBM7097568.1 hypothetical protein [Alteribacter salitolerans]
MRELMGVWRIVWIEMSKSFIYFWAILFGIVGLGILYTAVYQSDQVIFQTNAAVYVYFVVIGSQLFRLALTYGSSFGATRKQIYKGAVGSAVVLALLGSLIHTLVYLALDALTRWQAEEMSLAHITEFMTADPTVFTMYAVDVSFILMVTALGFSVSVLYYRFGPISLMIIGGLVALSAIIPDAREAVWMKLFNGLAESSLWETTGVVLIVAAVAFAGPYLMVRQFNIYLKEKTV